MLFTVKSNILLAKNNFEYIENKEYIFTISRELGEGSYGNVFEFNEKYAIKIFKQCTLGSIDLSSKESTLLPTCDENRELSFYFEMLKKHKDEEKRSIHYILHPYAIGFTKETICYGENEKRVKIPTFTYFLILPLCIPFYKALPVRNIDLISIQQSNDLFKNIDLSNYIHYEKRPFGVYFVLYIMKILLSASYYLEEEFKIYNLDFKFSNIMFLQNQKQNQNQKHFLLEDLIVIDFGLIKHVDYNGTFGPSSIFHYDDLIKEKYFIWPYSGTTLTSQIPSYSVCINGLELLFGKKEVEKLPSYRLIKKIIHKLKSVDHNLYCIFYEGLISKCSTKRLLLFLQNYLS